MCGGWWGSEGPPVRSLPFLGSSMGPAVFASTSQQHRRDLSFPVKTPRRGQHRPHSPVWEIRPRSTKGFPRITVG